MSRAKYTSDPRKCPLCGRKKLYARSTMVCVHVSTVDEESAYVSCDHCNGCKTDSFQGKRLSECRGEALLASAQAEEVQARHHQERAQLMRTMAANLGVLSPDE